jgi:hypothetical protein
MAPASTAPVSGADLDQIAHASTTLLGAPPTDLSFTRFDISPGMSYSYGFSIGDYGNDGKPDIAYFDSYVGGRTRLRTVVGAIGHIMWNDGTNDIIVPDETFSFTTSNNPDEFLLERNVPADLYGTGMQDIVGVSNSHGAVVAYINPGVRGATWTRQVLSANTPGAVNLTIADVNGDGHPDVIVAMRSNSQSGSPFAGIAWLENPGTPNTPWIYHNVDTTPGNYGDPRTVQAADINGDGKIDIVTSDAVTGMLAWYEQGATPDTWTRHVIPGVNTANAHFGRIVDMDGDGLPDIVQPVAQGVVWVQNVNKGQSWQVHQICQFTDPQWVNIVTEVAIGDMHHDGTRDVVFSVGSLSGGVASRHTGGVYIAHPVTGSWQVSQVYTTQNSVVGVQVVDFDNSGYALDIVSNTEYQQNSITLWKNTLSP